MGTGRIDASLYSNPEDLKGSTATEPKGFSWFEIREHAGEALAEEEAHRRALEEHTANPFKGVGQAWFFDTEMGVGLTKAYDEYKYGGFQDIEFNVQDAIEVDKDLLRHTSDVEYLSQAKGRDHYEVLKKRLAAKKDYLLNMEDIGVAGSFGVQMAAEILNVVNYATFGLGALSKLNKIKRFVTAGTIVGGANVLGEKFIDTEYHDRRASNYIAAGAMGFGLGWLGTFGKASKGAVRTAAQLDQMGDSFAKVHAKGAADDVAAFKRGVDPDDETGTVGAVFIGDAHEVLNPKKERGIGPDISTMDPDSPIVQDTVRAVLDGDIPRADKIWTESLGLSSMSQSLHSSENPIARYMTSLMGEHSEGVSSVNKHTAALTADRLYQKLVSTYAPTFVDLKRAFTKAGGPRAKYTFDEAIAAYAEGSRNMPGVSKDMEAMVKDVVDLQRKVAEATIERAKKAGVPEAGVMDPSHISRGWDPRKFWKMGQKHGVAKAIKALKGSILEGNDFKSFHKKAEEAWEKIQKANEDKHLASIKKLEEDIVRAEKAVNDADVSVKGLRASALPERLKGKLQKLRDAGPKIARQDPVDVEAVAEKMATALFNRFQKRSTTTTADANLLSSANRGLLLDALKSANLDDPTMFHINHILETAGKDHRANPMKKQMGMKLDYEADGIRVFDFMHTDMGNAFVANQRYWIGRTALAERGLVSEESFQAAIDQMKRHGFDRGMDDKLVTEDAKKLEAMWDLIVGKPIEDMSAPGVAIGRIVRKLVGASSLGKLGIVQASEIGRVMSAMGVTNTFKAIPMVLDMVSDFKAKKFDTAAMRDMEDWITGRIGGEHFMNHPEFRTDDFGHAISKWEKTLDGLSFTSSKWSGWQMVHNYQKKLLMQGLGMKWYREFTLGTMTDTQRRVHGIEPAMFEKIKKQMETHATPIEDSSAMHLHLGQWEPEAREFFADMLHRKTANAIQAIMVGETPLWMNKSLGKFMAQFRTFSMAALGKQTVRDYRMWQEGDKEAALAFQHMMATSSLSYVVKVGFDALTMTGDQRDNYLERALHPGAIVKGVLDYHGQTGPLMDMSEFLMDFVTPTSWGELTGDRYPQGGLLNNIPGVSYIERAYRGLQTVPKMLNPGEQVTKRDWNAFIGMFPLSTTYGIAALNRVVAGKVFDGKEKRNTGVDDARKAMQKRTAKAKREEAKEAKEPSPFNILK